MSVLVKVVGDGVGEGGGEVDVGGGVVVTGGGEVDAGGGVVVTGGGEVDAGGGGGVVDEVAEPALACTLEKLAVASDPA